MDIFKINAGAAYDNNNGTIDDGSPSRFFL
jgi:hypothetical protein